SGSCSAGRVANVAASNPFAAFFAFFMLLECCLPILSLHIQTLLSSQAVFCRPGLIFLSNILAHSGEIVIKIYRGPLVFVSALQDFWDRLSNDRFKEDRLFEGEYIMEKSTVIGIILGFIG